MSTMKIKREILQHIFIIPITTMVLLLMPVTAYAQQSASSNYKVNEVIFGTGGQDYCPKLSGETSPGAYCALVTAGELTIGNTKSSQFEAYGGFNTERNPFIEIDMLQPFVDLSVVKETKTGYGTAQLQVKAYLAHGYVLQIYGATPTNSGHAIPAMGAAAVPTMGTEQFGMNLAANSMVVEQSGPTVAFGSGAQQDIDGTFSYGEVSDGTGGRPVYNLANNFKYTSGDTIAFSTSSSSYTLYTLSYVMNVSGVTPGGLYTTAQTVVATATF